MSLTRARSPSSKNGLPDLRLLPDAPVPDGRTVLTSPDADRRAAGRGSRKASAAFHTRYQHRREPAHADPQDDQDQRTLPQRRRRAAADLARDTARQDELANLLQLDERNGSPTHPLRRPRPRQHLTTHRYTEKRAGSGEAPYPSRRRTVAGFGCKSFVQCRDAAARRANASSSSGTVWRTKARTGEVASGARAPRRPMDRRPCRRREPLPPHVSARTPPLRRCSRQDRAPRRLRLAPKRVG